MHKSNIRVSLLYLTISLMLVVLSFPTISRASEQTLSSDIHISIPADIKRISKNIWGVNIYDLEPMSGKDYLYTSKPFLNKQKTQELNIKIIRYMGGCLADTYDWKNSRIDMLIDLASYGNSPTWMGWVTGPNGELKADVLSIDEALEFSHDLGAELLYEVNMQHKHEFNSCKLKSQVYANLDENARKNKLIQDTKDLITQYKGKIQYFELGNEQYLKGWSAKEYAQSAILYANELWKVDPEVAVGFISDVRDKKSWDDTIKAELKNSPYCQNLTCNYFIAVHHYDVIAGSRDTPIQAPSYLDGIEPFGMVFAPYKKMRSEIFGDDSDMENLAITEWNIVCWTDGNDKPVVDNYNTVLQGFYVYGGFLEQIRNHVNIGIYHDLGQWLGRNPNYGCGMFRDANNYNPQGEVYKLTSKLGQSILLQTTVTGANIVYPDNNIKQHKRTCSFSSNQPSPYANCSNVETFTSGYPSYFQDYNDASAFVYLANGVQKVDFSYLSDNGTTSWYRTCNSNTSTGEPEQCIDWQMASLSTIPELANKTFGGIAAYTYVKGTTQYVQQSLIETNGTMTWYRDCPIDDNKGIQWGSCNKFVSNSIQNLRGVGNESYAGMTANTFTITSNGVQKTYLEQSLLSADGTKSWSRKCPLNTAVGVEWQSCEKSWLEVQINSIPNVKAKIKGYYSYTVTVGSNQILHQGYLNPPCSSNCGTTEPFLQSVSAYSTDANELYLYIGNTNPEKDIVTSVTFASPISIISSTISADWLETTDALSDRFTTRTQLISPASLQNLTIPALSIVRLTLPNPSGFDDICKSSTLFPQGDVNCDNVINHEDLLILSKYLFHQVPTLIQNGDLNNDSKINLADLIFLLKLL